MQFAARPRKAAENYAPQVGRCGQHIDHRLDGNFFRPIRRKSEHASRDGRKCNRSKAMDAAKLDTATIARCEQRIFVAGTAVPNRSDGMDHMPRREPVTFGNLGVAGLATVERPAFN
jgi:hypothetical protein